MTDPTEIVGLPVNFLVHPARLSSVPTHPPRNALREVKAINASCNKRCNDLGPFRWRCGEACSVGLVLPCGQAQGHWEIRADTTANFLNDLYPEATALCTIAAVLVTSLVGLRPEKLVDQITMCSMNFHSVKAELLRRGSGIAIGFDDLANFAFSRRCTNLSQGQSSAANDARWAEPPCRLGSSSNSPAAPSTCGLRTRPTCHSCGNMRPPQREPRR